MKITPKPSWKDKWVQESPAPITEMFYRCIGRLPTKEELKLYIDIVIMPRNDYEWLEKKRNSLINLIIKNDKKRRRKITDELSSSKKLSNRRML